MWNFTKHFQERMNERGISEEESLSIVEGKVPTLTYESEKYPDVDLVFGKVNSKYWLIPVNRKTKSLITVRPMRKAEKIQFNKEFKNEE